MPRQDLVVENPTGKVADEEIGYMHIDGMFISLDADGNSGYADSMV